LDVVSVGGLYSRRFRLSTPNFQLSAGAGNRKSETENFFSISEACFGRHRVSAPPPQRWAGYMGDPIGCQQPKTTKSSFFARNSIKPVELSKNPQNPGRFVVLDGCGKPNCKGRLPARESAACPRPAPPASENPGSAPS